jgi:hypothetical protein
MKTAVFRSHFRKSLLAADHLLDLMNDMIGQVLPASDEDFFQEIFFVVQLINFHLSITN